MLHDFFNFRLFVSFSKWIKCSLFIPKVSSTTGFAAKNNGNQPFLPSTRERKINADNSNGTSCFLNMYKYYTGRKKYKLILCKKLKIDKPLKNLF